MSYLGHGFQNRWLSDRFITTKSSSTVGRHRSICSMQIDRIRVPGEFTPETAGNKPLAEKQYEGRVEKTDPRSADYPLTPAPRTTLRTTPRTTLRTTPTDYPKNQPNSLYGVQKYKKLTCSSYTITTARKTAAIFFSYISRPSLFHFAPFSPAGHLPERCFHLNGRSVSAVEYLSL